MSEFWELFWNLMIKQLQSMDGILLLEVDVFICAILLRSP